MWVVRESASRSEKRRELTSPEEQSTTVRLEFSLRVPHTARAPLACRSPRMVNRSLVQSPRGVTRAVESLKRLVTESVTALILNNSLT